MGIGSILVQPQKIGWATGVNDDTALIQDVLNLVRVVADDAAQGGQIVPLIEAAVQATALRLQQRALTGFAGAQQKLRTWINPALNEILALSSTAPNAGTPAAGLALAQQLLHLLKQVVAGLTLDQLRAHLTTLFDILQNDLGMTANFIETQVWALFDDLIAGVEQMGADTPLRERNTRLAIACLLRRLKRRFQGEFKFPQLDVEFFARQLLSELRETGLDTVLQQATCALTGVGEALATGASLVKLVPFSADGTVGPSFSVRALADPAPVDHYRYGWYATWLLQYKYRDIPLLDTSDLKDAKRLANRLKNPPDAISNFLRNQLQAAERTAIDAYDGTSEPTNDLKNTLLDLLNRLLRGESDPLSSALLYSQGFPSVKLSEKTTDVGKEYAEDKELIRFNRMVLEDALPQDLAKLPREWYERLGAWLFELLREKALEWPGDRVAVDKAGKRVLLGDKILYTGDNVKWNQAPIFGLQGLPNGHRYYRFPHISPEFLEDWAFATAAVSDAVRLIWHLTQIKTNHEVGPSLNAAYDLTHVIISLATHRPISGFDYCKALDYWQLSPQVALTAAASFQGPAESRFSVLADDRSNLREPIEWTNLVRDATLSFMTLLNMGGPRDGPSTLPKQPADNHEEVGGIVGVAAKGFSYWLKALLIDKGFTGLFDGMTTEVFELWLFGGMGIGMLAGLSGVVVAEIIAWAEDWELLGLTMLKTIPGMLFDALFPT